MRKTSLDTFSAAASPRLERLYGNKLAPQLLDQIIALIKQHNKAAKTVRNAYWDQNDVILITYADTICMSGENPLRTLKRFLCEHLKGLINTVHILPFFPYSSDDGFSVIDYKTVDPELGDWEDIAAIMEDFDLMVDLVINHVSRESLWFVDYINNTPPACDYFIEVDPEVDLREVVRPRKGNLLTPVHTHRGLRHVWSTFSDDQIDLNFANPNVLLEFIHILLHYLHRGGRFIRLDAIAYLWKQLGTSCVNLEQTHEVVKLLREVKDIAAPDSILITETNLPHDQNISYFGDSNEAQIVYQFSLAPLLLHALHRGISLYLNQWARTSCTAPADCTFLNFTASHDGIGMRPAEGLIPQEELNALIESMHSFGGFVSTRSNPDGSESPYEINISYFDALKGIGKSRDQWQVPRFLTSQAIMLALKGIPALYIQSLIASPSDLHGVEDTGRTRSINRRKWDYSELSDLLENPFTPNSLVLKELCRLLAVRQQQRAFHPDAGQEILSLGYEFFGIRRHTATPGEEVLSISNLTEWQQHLNLEALSGLTFADYSLDLICGQPITSTNGSTILQPYQTLWLKKG